MKGLNLLELDPEIYPNLRELGERQKDWLSGTE